MALLALLHLCLYPLKEKNADFVRVSQMGERLLDNQSYGCQEVSVKLQTLKCQWEEFQRQLQRWSDLFHHSSQLHSKAKEVSEWEVRGRRSGANRRKGGVGRMRGRAGG